MSLPTYQEAITGTNIPSLIAPYLDLSTLQFASRVNRAWAKAMTRQIWADPLRSFSASSHPYTQTVRFIEDSPNYRVEVRNLVTTIDTRPLLARRYAPTLQKEFSRHELEIGYNRILERLDLFKYLRFVILDDLGRCGEDDDIPLPPAPQRTLGILLFNAHQITFDAISNVLGRVEFQDLMFLDLSYSLRMEDLKIALPLHRLRILKLRGLGLTTIPRLILELGSRLWSLDLRDNLLQDESIVLLLKFCFKDNYPNLLNTEDAYDEIHHLYDNPPVYTRNADDSASANFLPLRPDSTASFVRYITDNGNLYRNQRVLPESDPMYVSSGLTHLYISGNKITSSLVNTILCSKNRLQVLDVGSTRVNYNIPYKTVYAVPHGCEQITAVSGCRLEQLRIHHSAITRIPNILPSESAAGYDLESLKQAEGMMQKDWSFRLTPLSHHRLKSLTLTDIPTKSYGPLITQLELLLKECADQEEKLAAARAAMPQNRRAPQVLSGLKTLRFEFLPEAPSSQTTSSVSGDRDADGFLSRSLSDFSFFGGSWGAEWVEKKGGKGKEREREGEKAEKPQDVVESLRVFRRAQKPAGWGGTLELVWPRGR